MTFSFWERGEMAVEIGAEPYEGLRHSLLVMPPMAVHDVEIGAEPYEGLRHLDFQPEAVHGFLVEIGAEPYEGLRHVEVDDGGGPAPQVEIGAEPYEGLRQDSHRVVGLLGREWKSAPNLTRDCNLHRAKGG